MCWEESRYCRDIWTFCNFRNALQDLSVLARRRTIKCESGVGCVGIHYHANYIKGQPVPYLGCMEINKFFWLLTRLTWTKYACTDLNFIALAERFVKTTNDENWNDDLLHFLFASGNIIFLSQEFGWYVINSLARPSSTNFSLLWYVTISALGWYKY